ncbi:MAG: V-type ATP synthase subunit F [Olsenella sp.]|jgi:V/A-type H+-transporting ATPase subunit F
MDRIAVIGDYDSIYGFGALGLDLFPVSTDDPEAAATLRQLASEESRYGIIYMTEELADALRDVVAKYAQQPLPAIIPIPGVKNNTGVGVEMVKHSVEQSVGSDILFGKD